MRSNKRSHHGQFAVLKILCIVLLLGIIMGPVWAFCQMRDDGMKTSLNQVVKERYVEGEVLVKFKQGITSSDAVSRMGAYNLNIKKRFTLLSKIKGSTYALVASKTRSTAQIMADMERDTMVEAVSPNYVRTIDSMPNDPSFGVLWGLHNTGQTVNTVTGTVDADIDAPEAWDATTGSTDVIIAVVDTGVAYDHEDLAANMWTNPLETPGNGIDDDGNGYVDDVYGIDTVNEDSDPMDDDGHGSHCAGTIAAVGNNGTGVAGVNWTARIMALKFISSLGWGYDADAIEAIEYIIDQKVNHNQNVVAINASWGGGDYNVLLSDAIEAAGGAGIVFCAAAGNDGEDNDITPHYPSSYDLPCIIAVARTTSSDALSSSSCYGAVSVDLGAPGSNIYSTISYFNASTDGNIFYDDMESGFGKWYTNNTWAITDDRESFYTGGATRSFSAPPSGYYFLSDSPGVNYVASTDSWVGCSSDIDLSVYADQTVYFSSQAAFVCDWWWAEKAIIEISNNGGADWTTLFDLSDWYLYYNYWGWAADVIVIPDSFKTANFRFRFHFISDSDDNDPGSDDAGWVIDDVAIGTALTKGYGYKSGTSMATPHVAGAVGLLAAKRPNESVAMRKNRILRNVDKIPALSGKTVTGGRLNIEKAINAASGSLPAVNFLLMQ